MIVLNPTGPGLRELQLRGAVFGHQRGGGDPDAFKMGWEAHDADMSRDEAERSVASFDWQDWERKSFKEGYDQAEDTPRYGAKSKHRLATERSR